MTVDDRLRSAHARIPDPDEATIARARALLLEELGGGEAERCRNGARSVRFLHRRTRSLRFALPLTALALAVVAAVAIIPRDSERPVATGGDVLYQRNMLSVGAMYIGRDGRPTMDALRARYRITSTMPEELWLAPDGSGRLVHGEASAPRPATAADEREWRKAGSPDLDALARSSPPRARTDFGPNELSDALVAGGLDAVLPEHDPLSALPTEPLELRDLLLRAARKQNPRGTARGNRNRLGAAVVTLLAYPESTREQRAALIGIVRNLAGTRELGERTDPAGRTVRAFRLPADMAGGPVLAIDPATDRLLARGTMAGEAVLWGASYAITRSHVAEVGDRR